MKTSSFFISVKLLSNLTMAIIPFVFMSSFTADNILFDFIGQKETEGESRKNIIKACSEALVYAVAKCYAPIHIWKGFKESFLQKSFKN